MLISTDPSKDILTEGCLLFYYRISAYLPNTTIFEVQNYFLDKMYCWKPIIGNLLFQKYEHIRSESTHVQMDSTRRHRSHRKHTKPDRNDITSTLRPESISSLKAQPDETTLDDLKDESRDERVDGDDGDDDDDDEEEDNEDDNKDDEDSDSEDDDSKCCPHTHAHSCTNWLLIVL